MIGILLQKTFARVCVCERVLHIKSELSNVQQKFQLHAR
jgi:hypothetical protein